jgi:hypothetical protein
MVFSNGYVKEYLSAIKLKKLKELNVNMKIVL